MPMSSHHKRLQPTPGVVSPWYRTTDLMALFGVTDRTIQKWVSAGRLPQPVRKGRAWVRWPKTTIDALVANWLKGGAA